MRESGWLGFLGAELQHARWCNIDYIYSTCGQRFAPRNEIERQRRTKDKRIQSKPSKTHFILLSTYLRNAKLIIYPWPAIRIATPGHIHKHNPLAIHPVRNPPIWHSSG